MVQSTIDFMLGIFSSILQMNMRDHHEIPFALPLVAASATGFVIGFAILRMIGNENKADKAKIEQSEQSEQ